MRRLHNSWSPSVSQNSKIGDAASKSGLPRRTRSLSPTCSIIFVGSVRAAAQRRIGSRLPPVTSKPRSPSSATKGKALTRDENEDALLDGVRDREIGCITVVEVQDCAAWLATLPNRRGGKMSPSRQRKYLNS